MLKVNIHEAKTHLSKYVRRIKAGETILLCDRNVPFAEIRPVASTETSAERPFGLFAGQIQIADNFDAADEQVERDFEGANVFPGE